MNKVDWNYYNKFEDIMKKYLSDSGEGETLASQTVTAINKLIYKWYNDGDVYDNTYNIEGWVNDLSSYANWLYKNIKGAKDILNKISYILIDDEYEMLLKELADNYLNKDFLDLLNDKSKTGSIYECDGPFEFLEEQYEDDEDEEW